MNEPVNYAKLDWEYKQWYARFKKYVESRVPPLICQDCRGAGGEVDVILDDGTGPWEMCGWCQGTGYVTPWIRSDWLRYKKQEKEKDNANRRKIAAIKGKEGSLAGGH